MWMWIALFTLPFMYRTCRHALDALVEETLLFVAEVVRGGEHPHGCTAPSAGHLLLCQPWQHCSCFAASICVRTSRSLHVCGNALVQ